MILSSASPVGLVLGLATAAAYALQAVAGSRQDTRFARPSLLVAWLLHGTALAWSMLGGTPHFGFGPAISITAWLVLTVYLVESQVYPLLKARWALALLGACAVLLALLFPGKPLHVSASAWLPLHLALGIASYGLFAAAVVHAWLMMRSERQMRMAETPSSGIPLLTMERLTFRFVTAGFVLLTATLLAGCLARRCTATPGSGTTRRCSRCWPGWCLPRCCWAARVLAGGAARPCGCCMWARCCC